MMMMRRRRITWGYAGERWGLLLGNRVGVGVVNVV